MGSVHAWPQSAVAALSAHAARKAEQSCLRKDAQGQYRYKSSVIRCSFVNDRKIGHYLVKKDRCPFFMGIVLKSKRKEDSLDLYDPLAQAAISGQISGAHIRGKYPGHR